MSKIRSICEDHLSDKQAECFAEWAFGPDFKKQETKDHMRKWNELHSDKLILEGHGIPSDDIPKMIKIWKESKDENSF